MYFFGGIFEHHKLSVVQIYYAGEKADISTTLHLKPKQSLVARGITCILDFRGNCLFKNLISNIFT